MTKQTLIQKSSIVERLIAKSTLEHITSNGTIAAGVMVCSALLALIVANSALFEPVHKVFAMHIGISFGTIGLFMPLETFINDFLMSIFFLLVGIELKYEMVVGELRRPRQAMLPMLAAVGGVCAPALIYTLLNPAPTAHGWAIPIATDIAFALGIMSLLGKRIAAETKVFFSTLAIADDLLAIVVLALFYGQALNISWCAATLIVIVLLAACARGRIYSSKPYLILGVALWFCMFNSGIHPTLSGVILAFFLPAKSDIHFSHLHMWLSGQVDKLEGTLVSDEHILGQHEATATAKRIEHVVHRITPPLQRMEHYISVAVNFVILPLFAFSNAQLRLVDVNVLEFACDSVSQGVFLGAVIGKPLGIILVTFILVKIGFAKLPNHVDWVQIIGVGIMGALGFTMSILISGLAFSSEKEILAAKFAVLVGSFTASILGILFIRIAQSTRAKAYRKRVAQKLTAK